MKKKIGETLPYIWFLILFGVLGILVLFSKSIAEGVSYGIRLSLESLIPSLYFFMVVSGLIANTGLCRVLSYPFRFIARHIFHLESSLFTIFVLSALGGYPIGAKLISDKIKNGEITPETGQFMMGFCVNCSPAFLISYAAVRLWDSVAIGLILYAAQLLSCAVIAFVTGFGKPCHTTAAPNSTPEKVPFTQTLVETVNGTTKTMAVICSFVIVFCAFFPLVDSLPLPENAEFLVKGLLEVTSGCDLLSGTSVYYGILFCALFTAFGGACVFLQVFALLAGTNIRFFHWLVVRLFHTMLSVLFTYGGILLLKPSIDCIATNQGVSVKPYTSSPVASVGMLVLAGMLLLISVRSNKIKVNPHKGKGQDT